jgi:hypothetical protein
VEAETGARGVARATQVFDNVKTLSVAGRHVEQLDKALKPMKWDDDEGSTGVQTLFLPKARQVAGSPVNGP